MSVVTRPAVEVDLEALVAIENAAFAGDRLSRRSLATLMKKPSALILVADHQDRVAGYAALLFRTASRKARLYSIAVAPSERGVGRELLAAAEQAARRHGAQSIQLEVREDNDRAISFYQKSGYQRFGSKLDYYADGAAALRFSKALIVPEKAAPPGLDPLGTSTR